MRIEALTHRDGVIIKNLDSGRVLFSHNADKTFEAASVVKVYYAAVLGSMITGGRVENKLISVDTRMVLQEGTNILRDIIPDGGKLNLPTSVLIRLMLKYSCNASTQVLFDNYFSGQKSLEEHFAYYKIKKAEPYDNNGNWKNFWSIDDLVRVFEDIYLQPQIYGSTGKLIRESLQQSRNIYYLFDQLGVKVLGTKAGTVVNKTGAQVNNIGIVDIGGQRYTWGAMINRDKINEAVEVIRGIGKETLKQI